MYLLPLTWVTIRSSRRFLLYEISWIHSKCFDFLEKGDKSYISHQAINYPLHKSRTNNHEPNMEPDTQAYSTLRSRALHTSMTRVRLLRNTLCELPSLHVINMKNSENHTAVDNKIVAFWDVIPCNLVNIYQRFLWICCLILQGHLTT
jgi:hypothetical protein